jgi:predicted amidohydrolase YtcJ
MDPLAGLHAAVTRQRAGGMPPGGWQPEQRLGVEQALRCYYAGGAEAAADHGVLARIAPAYAADLVALSDDVFAIEPEAIARTKVELTVCNGEIVYDREG